MPNPPKVTPHLVEGPGGDVIDIPDTLTTRPPFRVTLERLWSCWFPTLIILVTVAVVVAFPLFSELRERSRTNNRGWLGFHSHTGSRVFMCKDRSDFDFVETIPRAVKVANGPETSVFEGLMKLVKSAESEIDIISSYWKLRNSERPPPGILGARLFAELMNAGLERGVKVRIVQDQPMRCWPNKDTEMLQKIGAAEVRNLNFLDHLGHGLVHTNMWLVDKKHFYVGSANADWRSLEKVKEFGIITSNCSCMAHDMLRIFELYWYLGKPNPVPKRWPDKYVAMYNKKIPLYVKVKANMVSSWMYLSASPDHLCPPDRASDIDAVLSIINKAEMFVYIVVMDYFPNSENETSSYLHSMLGKALEDAAERVDVRILFYWSDHEAHSHTPLQFPNVTIKDSVQMKIFNMPYPEGRTNHNKYIVTEKSVFFGTSSWTNEYFQIRGGIGISISQVPLFGNRTCMEKPLIEKMKDVFERDWASPHVVKVRGTPYF